MTTEFLEGDLVEAVKGERLLRDRVTQYDLGKALCIGEGGATIDWHERNGFTLTIIERPKPKAELPSEPGWYIGNDRLAENPYFLMFVTPSGGTYRPDATAFGGLSEIGDVGRFAPFIRLESRADTAKAVIERIRRTVQKCDQGMHDGLATRSHLREVLQTLESEFGVTDA